MKKKFWQWEKSEYLILERFCGLLWRCFIKENRRYEICLGIGTVTHANWDLIKPDFIKVPRLRIYLRFSLKPLHLRIFSVDYLFRDHVKDLFLFSKTWP